MPGLRIAMLVPPWYELPPRGYGGIELVVTELIGALMRRGHEVTLFGAGTRTGTGAAFVTTRPDPQHTRIGQSLPELVHVAQADRLIDDGGFDVVHDHTSVGLVTAASRSTPTVSTVHGCPTGELGDFLRASSPAAGLVAISHAQRRLGDGLDWAATVHHGLTVAGPARPEVGAGPVLWLARFTPEKGPDLAIAACRAAALPLVLAGKCGEPEEQRYLDEVIRPLLHPGVQLVTNPPAVHYRELLSRARCLLLPVRWEEPFGLVMLEAMAAGTPVVALRRGAVGELVRDGETGVVCDDPDHLADALHAAAGLDPAACTEHVRTRFSPDLMAQGYERVYRDRAACPR
ncbi:MAG TPA: glycosyltransferase [Rugosimonospora sp.]|nr:glycosyltransferase [Rugosimonospora sp.]